MKGTSEQHQKAIAQHLHQWDKGVVGYDMTGVACGPSYIYPNTTAIAGIININATEPPCTRVTDEKLVHHYLERGGEKLSEQIAKAIEFSFVVEAKLALENKASQQTQIFLARKDLLNHLAFSALPEDQQNFYAYTNAPFVLEELQYVSPREIIIKPRPIVPQTPPSTPGTPSPTISPMALRLNVLLMAAYIIDESIKSGYESYRARKSIELLFLLYKAFDDASLTIDFDEIFTWRILDPLPGDKELLRQLKQLYDAGELLNEDDLNLFYWLLCSIESDCRGPDPLKFEWHHVIPREREGHPLVVAAKQCSDKFYFDGDNNLMSLEKYIVETGNGRHGNHPQYNEWILRLMDMELQRFLEDNNDVAMSIQRNFDEFD
jgi:hypothetical protein